MPSLQQSAMSYATTVGKRARSLPATASLPALPAAVA